LVAAGVASEVDEDAVEAAEPPRAIEEQWDAAVEQQTLPAEGAAEAPTWAPTVERIAQTRRCVRGRRTVMLRQGRMAMQTDELVSIRRRLAR
jgi:hypothetical protein